MATVFTTDRWPRQDQTWEPPYDVVFGVTDESCGARYCTQARVIVPPGGGNQYHVHEGADALGYVVRGRFRNGVGGDVLDIAAGDFWHFTAGEKHWSHNLSDTDICMMIASYTKVSSLAGTKTRFIDPATAPAPSSDVIDQLPAPGRYGEPARSRILKRADQPVETDEATGITITWGANRDNSDTGDGISLLLSIPVGKATPLAAIENAETAAFVLNGRVVVESGDPLSRDEASAGSFIFIPPGEPARFTSVGDIPAELYVVHAGPRIGRRGDMVIRPIKAVPA
ncbi:MAG: cupin domain-containing protein [Chloroflexi bacterium]|nr:cupin domain-containing protein [Chloroflexota bacterium]